MTGIRLTHIGGPSVLIEAERWRILTDPTFDPPGKTYKFAGGSTSTKLSGLALAPDDIGPLRAVLLSHDHHADDLTISIEAHVAFTA
jgi:L-ascorbate metabolism protein UlaG (beta-lactamase superfamily)